MAVKRVEGVEPLRISTDPALLDVQMIHRYLSQESYWASGIGREVLERAIARSLCFGGYLGERQVAFARVVTDGATYAHLKDVFVLPEYRDRGYGIALIEAVMGHPDLKRVAFTLGTADAHGLYTRFGFGAPPAPERAMLRPGTFLDSTESGES